MHLKIRRPIASAVAVIYVCSQVVFGSTTESNFWSDRRQASVKQNPSTAQQYAALPTSYSNGSNPTAILSQLPSVRAMLPTVPKWSESNKIKSAQLPRKFQALIDSISLLYGSIQEVYDSGNDQVGFPVVLLQDVHLNPEAQGNIAAVLQELIDQKQLSFVGVEGVFQRFDFRGFRRFSDREITKKVAQSFVEKDLLGAPSFVGITSPVEPPPFAGVDDRAHYDANVQAYLSTQKQKSQVRQLVRGLNFDLSQLKQKIFSSPLKQFDDLRMGYHQGDMNFGSYVKKLATYGTEHHFVVDQFLEAYSMESALDFASVERERKLVLEKLTKALSEKEISNLVADSLSYRAGKLSFGTYYRNLKDLCAQKRVLLTQTPAFDNYIRYVLLSDGIKADALFNDVQKMEKDVLRTLVVNADQQNLADLSEQVALADKLLDFALTSNEWEQYRQLSSYDIGSRSASTILDGAMKTKYETMKTSLSSFENFYREADVRSNKMVANLLKGVSQVEPAELSSAALVVGGFHTSQIAKLLRDGKISYVVVSPKITKVDDSLGSSYLSVFARDKAPLDRIFAGEKLFVKPAYTEIPNPEASVQSRLAQLIIAAEHNHDHPTGPAVLPESVTKEPSGRYDANTPEGQQYELDVQESHQGNDRDSEGHPIFDRTSVTEKTDGSSAGQFFSRLGAVIITFTNAALTLLVARYMTHAVMNGSLFMAALVLPILVLLVLSTMSYRRQMSIAGAMNKLSKQLKPIFGNRTSDLTIDQFVDLLRSSGYAIDHKALLMLESVLGPFGIQYVHFDFNGLARMENGVLYLNPAWFIRTSDAKQNLRKQQLLRQVIAHERVHLAMSRSWLFGWTSRFALLNLVFQEPAAYVVMLFPHLMMRLTTERPQARLNKNQKAIEKQFTYDLTRQIQILKQSVSESDPRFPYLLADLILVLFQEHLSNGTTSRGLFLAVIRSLKSSMGPVYWKAFVWALQKKAGQASSSVPNGTNMLLGELLIAMGGHLQVAKLNPTVLLMKLAESAQQGATHQQKVQALGSYLFSLRKSGYLISAENRTVLEQTLRTLLNSKSMGRVLRDAFAHGKSQGQSLQSLLEEVGIVLEDSNSQTQVPYTVVTKPAAVTPQISSNDADLSEIEIPVVDNTPTMPTVTPDEGSSVLDMPESPSNSSDMAAFTQLTENVLEDLGIKNESDEKVVHATAAEKPVTKAADSSVVPAVTEQPVTNKVAPVGPNANGNASQAKKPVRGNVAKKDWRSVNTAGLRDKTQPSAERTPVAESKNDFNNEGYEPTVLFLPESDDRPLASDDPGIAVVRNMLMSGSGASNSLRDGSNEKILISRLVRAVLLGGKNGAQVLYGGMQTSDSAIRAASQPLTREEMDDTLARVGPFLEKLRSRDELRYLIRSLDRRLFLLYEYQIDLLFNSLDLAYRSALQKKLQQHILNVQKTNRKEMSLLAILILSVLDEKDFDAVAKNWDGKSVRMDWLLEEGVQEFVTKLEAWRNEQRIKGNRDDYPKLISQYLARSGAPKSTRDAIGKALGSYVYYSMRGDAFTPSLAPAAAMSLLPDVPGYTKSWAWGESVGVGALVGIFILVALAISWSAGFDVQSLVSSFSSGSWLNKATAVILSYTVSFIPSLVWLQSHFWIDNLRGVQVSRSPRAMLLGSLILHSAAFAAALATLPFAIGLPVILILLIAGLAYTTVHALGHYIWNNVVRPSRALSMARENETPVIDRGPRVSALLAKVEQTDTMNLREILDPLHEALKKDSHPKELSDHDVQIMINGLKGQYQMLVYFNGRIGLSGSLMNILDYHRAIVSRDSRAKILQALNEFFGFAGLDKADPQLKELLEVAPDYFKRFMTIRENKSPTEKPKDRAAVLIQAARKMAVVLQNRIHPDVFDQYVEAVEKSHAIWGSQLAVNDVVSRELESMAQLRLSRTDFLLVLKAASSQLRLGINVAPSQVQVNESDLPTSLQDPRIKTEEDIGQFLDRAGTVNGKTAIEWRNFIKRVLVGDRQLAMVTRGEGTVLNGLRDKVRELLRVKKENLDAFVRQAGPTKGKTPDEWINLINNVLRGRGNLNMITSGQGTALEGLRGRVEELLKAGYMPEQAAPASVGPVVNASQGVVTVLNQYKASRTAVPVMSGVPQSGHAQPVKAYEVSAADVEQALEQGWIIFIHVNGTDQFIWTITPDKQFKGFVPGPLRVLDADRAMRELPKYGKDGNIPVYSSPFPNMGTPSVFPSGAVASWLASGHVLAVEGLQGTYFLIAPGVNEEDLPQGAASHLPSGPWLQPIDDLTQDDVAVILNRPRIYIQAHVHHLNSAEPVHAFFERDLVLSGIKKGFIKVFKANREIQIVNVSSMDLGLLRTHLEGSREFRPLNTSKLSVWLARLLSFTPIPAFSVRGMSTEEREQAILRNAVKRVAPWFEPLIFVAVYMLVYLGLGKAFPDMSPTTKLILGNAVAVLIHPLMHIIGFVAVNQFEEFQLASFWGSRAPPTLVRTQVFGLFAFMGSIINLPLFLTLPFIYQYSIYVGAALLTLGTLGAILLHQKFGTRFGVKIIDPISPFEKFAGFTPGSKRLIEDSILGAINDVLAVNPYRVAPVEQVRPSGPSSEQVDLLLKSVMELLLTRLEAEQSSKPQVVKSLDQETTNPNRARALVESTDIFSRLPSSVQRFVGGLDGFVSVVETWMSLDERTARAAIKRFIDNNRGLLPYQISLLEQFGETVIAESRDHVSKRPELSTASGLSPPQTTESTLDLSLTPSEMAEQIEDIFSRDTSPIDPRYIDIINTVGYMTFPQIVAEIAYSANVSGLYRNMGMQLYEKDPMLYLLPIPKDFYQKISDYLSLADRDANAARALRLAGQFMAKAVSAQVKAGKWDKDQIVFPGLKTPISQADKGSYLAIAMDPVLALNSIRRPDSNPLGRHLYIIDISLFKEGYTEQLIHELNMDSQATFILGNILNMDLSSIRPSTIFMSNFGSYMEDGDLPQTAWLSDGWAHSWQIKWEAIFSKWVQQSSPMLEIILEHREQGPSDGSATANLPIVQALHNTLTPMGFEHQIGGFDQKGDFNPGGTYKNRIGESWVSHRLSNKIVATAKQPRAPLTLPVTYIVGRWFFKVLNYLTLKTTALNAIVTDQARLDRFVEIHFAKWAESLVHRLPGFLGWHGLPTSDQIRGQEAIHSGAAKAGQMGLRAGLRISYTFAAVFILSAVYFMISPSDYQNAILIVEALISIGSPTLAKSMAAWYGSVQAHGAFNDSLNQHDVSAQVAANNSQLDQETDVVVNVIKSVLEHKPSNMIAGILEHSPISVSDMPGQRRTATMKLKAAFEDRNFNALLHQKLITAAFNLRELNDQDRELLRTALLSLGYAQTNIDNLVRYLSPAASRTIIIDDKMDAGIYKNLSSYLLEELRRVGATSTTPVNIMMTPELLKAHPDLETRLRSQYPALVIEGNLSDAQQPKLIRALNSQLTRGNLVVCPSQMKESITASFADQQRDGLALDKLLKSHDDILPPAEFLDIDHILERFKQALIAA